MVCVWEGACGPAPLHGATYCATVPQRYENHYISEHRATEPMWCAKVTWLLLRNDGSDCPGLLSVCDEGGADGHEWGKENCHVAS